MSQGQIGQVIQFRSGRSDQVRLGPSDQVRSGQADKFKFCQIGQGMSDGQIRLIRSRQVGKVRSVRSVEFMSD